MNRLLGELRRRRVLRTGAAYVVAAWVLLQVADLGFESLGLPDVALRYVWLGLFLGFPLALVFAWRYDLTAAGIVRTPALADREKPDLSLRGVDYVVLVVLLTVGLSIAARIVGNILGVDELLSDRAPAGITEGTTIAVLPLDNLSGSEDQAYLAAGMHDALITALSRIGSLRVTSRTSNLRVDEALTVPDIGERLGVARVVDGTVTREGDRVRVNVQLVDTVTDQHIWARSYERDFAGVLALQNEVALDIAGAIEIQLTPDEQARLPTDTVVDPATYEAYLRGMYQLHKDTREGFRKGMQILTEAVENDPTSALAYAGLAYGYAKIGHSFMPDRRSNPRLKYAATKALELDPDLAEGHLAMGMVHLHADWDFEAAEVALRRAIELSPSLVAAHYHLAWLYELVCRDEEAIAAGELTVALDPLSPFYAGWLAEQYRDAGMLDEAVTRATEMTEFAPRFPVGWFALGCALADQGLREEAMAAHARLEGMPWWSWARTYSYARAGRVAEVRAIAEALGEDPDYAIPLFFHADLGDMAAVNRWLDVARDGNFPWYPWLVAWFHELRPFYDQPAFRERAAALNLELPQI